VPKTILIVDDSEVVRHAVRTLFEQQTDLVVCGEAIDGMDAIEKTEKLKPDLIVLDLVMPKLNGAAAASVLRRTVPSVQIILFTMYEDAVDALASAIGVDVVLSKPDGLSNLVQRVRDLLDSRPTVEHDHPIQHSPHRAGQKVLVVEDFDRFRQFVVSMLHEKPGFQVTQASDGLEAVRRAEEQRPDLVLLDIGLPGLTG